MTARPTSSDRGLGKLRRHIATQAARLIAEEGIDDFSFAKRKAARQLGVPERDLPTNAEVEEALAVWRSLYRDEDDDERLSQMRRAAIEVMRLLAPFRPYATGAVIDGLGDAFCELELEVFADSAKDVEIFLLGKGLAYEHQDVRRGGHDGPEAILIFDFDEVPVKLSIYDHLAERSPRRSHAGTVQERLRLGAFEAMLASALDATD